jgi:hypothetical protein
MTLYEFNLLDHTKQLETIYSDATFSDNNITKVAICNLYALDMFFVELTYNYETNKVDEIKSFKTGNLFLYYVIVSFKIILLFSNYIYKN